MVAISDCFEAYGYRRMQAALRQQGIVVNHKKLRRLMREHDLQPRRRRRYVATTDGEHDLPIFPNLAREIVPDGPDQLWVADITYLAIPTGFVYVAVILDAWSRKVVGYAIARSIDVRLTLAALQSAVQKRRPPPGCIHHTDRGSQLTFKRSSQHSDVGGCDDFSKAAITPIWASAVAITGTATRSAAIRTSAVLVGDCRGDAQRECCAGGGYIAACRSKIVPKGRRHAPIDV